MKTEKYDALIYIHNVINVFTVIPIFIVYVTRCG